jgi:hypothetical protein
MNAGVQHHAFASIPSAISPIFFDQDASQSCAIFLVNAKQKIFSSPITFYVAVFL